MGSGVPPAARPDIAKDGIDAVTKVNSATGLIYGGAMLSATKAEQASRQAKIGGKLFEHTGNGLAVLGQVNAVGNAAMRGDVPGVLKASGAAIVDRCADVAIDVACALSGPAAPACIVGVQAVRFCGETWMGKSVGELTVEVVSDGIESVDRFAREKRAEREATIAGQQQRFQSAQSGNDAQASAMSEPGQYSSGGDDGSVAFMGAIMGGLANVSAANRQSPPSPPSPVATPAPAQTAAPEPTGCHAGHNEERHPGGCHSAPLGVQ